MRLISRCLPVFKVIYDEISSILSLLLGGGEEVGGL